MSDSILDSDDFVYTPIREFTPHKVGEKYIDDRGHEIVSYWGASFDLTRMKEPPKEKKCNSKSGASISLSSDPASDAGAEGHSNTLGAIRQVSTNGDIVRSGNSSVGNAETCGSDDFRVTEKKDVQSLYQYFLDSEVILEGGFFRPDGSIFETWNSDEHFERPSICDLLPPARHFKNPDKILNPWGPFAGYDGGTRAAYWGEWDRGLVKYWLKAWDKMLADHKEHLEPIRFQVYEGAEDWLFRCAGNGERNTAGYPSFSQAPDLDIYVLERGGIKILLYPPEYHDDPSLPDFVVFYGSECFRNLTRASLVEKFVFAFMEQFGFTPWEQCTKIRRIDIQITTDLYTVDEVRKAAQKGFIVCRADDSYDQQRKRSNPNGTKNNGTMYFGRRTSGSCVLRAYDKQAELEAHKLQDRGRKQFEFYAALGPSAFVQSMPLTRFEFELHKKFLDQFEVTSFEDFERKLPSIVDYLTQDWFRILDTEKGNNHSDRAKASKMWADISASFKTVAEYFATENNGEIFVTRKTRDEKAYMRRDWTKQVKTAVDFAKRGVGEMILALGIDDPRLVDDSALELYVFPELRRVLPRIRDYVRTRGEGGPKYRSFIEFDPRQFIKEGLENGYVKVPIEVFS